MARRLLIVCPESTGRQGGNRITARRWETIARDLGWTVRIRTEDDGRPADAALVLHARRSARAAARLAARGVPHAVALTGTDLYVDLPTSAAATRSLEHADRLVLLQPLGRAALPPAVRRKARVLHQSLDPALLLRRRAAARRRDGGLRVCVLGHLRPVKDPLRTALATHHLPPASRLEVVHVGRALSPRMEARARAEQAANPRYRWIGERPRHAALEELARSDVLVVSSRAEGGANVIGEAATLGVAILASRIDGNVGLLGARHRGLFEVGDTAALRRLLLRCEEDPAFLRLLRDASARIAPLFDRARERDGLDRLLRELTRRSHGERRTRQGSAQVRKPAKTSRRSGP